MKTIEEREFELRLLLRQCLNRLEQDTTSETSKLRAQIYNALEGQ